VFVVVVAAEVVESIGFVAQFNLNGRQIKNVIRLSQSLSAETNTPVTTDAIVSTIELTGQFIDELTEQTQA
jgi:hypothetical protein